MHDPILSGLAKRRAELVTEVKRTEGILRGLIADIESLDAVSRQFDPDHRPHQFKASLGLLERASTTKAVLAILRMASGPMTMRAITVEIMARRGQDTTGRRSPR